MGDLGIKVVFLGGVGSHRCRTLSGHHLPAKTDLSHGSVTWDFSTPRRRRWVQPDAVCNSLRTFSNCFEAEKVGLLKWTSLQPNILLKVKKSLTLTVMLWISPSSRLYGLMKKWLKLWFQPRHLAINNWCARVSFCSIYACAEPIAIKILSSSFLWTDEIVYFGVESPSVLRAWFPKARRQKSFSRTCSERNAFWLRIMAAQRTPSQGESCFRLQRLNKHVQDTVEVYCRCQRFEAVLNKHIDIIPGYPALRCCFSGWWSRSRPSRSRCWLKNP